MPTCNQPALRVVARDSDYSPSPPTDRHPSPSERSAESTRPVRWGGRGPAALDTEFHGIYGKGKRQASLSAT